MFSGKNHAAILHATPTAIEINYTSTTYVGVGEFSDFDISVDPVTTPSDPDGAPMVQYYRISIKFEAVQTGTNEFSVLSDTGQLNAVVGLKITYPWGSFTIPRTSHTFRLAVGYSGSSDEGAMVLRFSGDMIVTPSQLASMIAYT